MELVGRFLELFTTVSSSSLSDQGHINGIRVPTYDGPITDVTSNVRLSSFVIFLSAHNDQDLICNGGTGS